MHVRRRDVIMGRDGNQQNPMRISADKLAGQLAKKLSPSYLISGDEPLLVDEAADRVRARAREEGFLERERHVGAAQGFDWGRLGAAANMSLFASKKLVEVRIPSGKPGAKGGKALEDYARHLDTDTCLLVITPKLDSRVAGNNWVKALDSAGLVVQVWPVTADRLPAWIAARMKARGLQPVGDAVKVLVERVEGNLLAADQEIEKLALQLGEGQVDAADVARGVADSARFDVYDLSAAALRGETARAVRVLDGLRAEGVAEALVVWSLNRELRVLCAMFAAAASGTPMDAVFRNNGVWSTRKTLLTGAYRRLRSAAVVYDLLDRAIRCEALVKGQTGVKKTEAADRWRGLTGLVMAICGIRTRIKAAV